MSFLSDFNFSFTLLIVHKFSEKLFQRIFALLSCIFYIHHVLLTLFEYITLILQKFIHCFVFFCCIDSFDGCKCIGHSVKNKNIFDVNHHWKSSMMGHSLAFNIIKNICFELLPLRIKVINSLLIGLRFFLILLNVVLNRWESLFSAWRIKNIKHSRKQE